MHSIDYIRKRLSYDTQNGIFIWIKADASFFKNITLYKSWNNQWAGKVAGSPVATGHIYITLDRKKYLAHRVAWAITHGEWPEGEIDHINHDPSDNRLCNLRVVTRAQNAQNMSLPKDNTSGIIGVSFNKKSSKWVAYITVNRKRMPLGYFKCITAAETARKLAEIKYGFHINHGAPSILT